MKKTIIKFVIQKPMVFLICASLLALEVLAADEPTAIWLFDEKDNNIVKDLSGNGHDGKINGAVDWTKDGQFGGALAFIGKDGWIEVEDHKNFHFPKGTDFTLACWVKITGDHAQPPMLIAKSYGLQGQKKPWYALYYANQGKQSDGDISFFCRDTAGTSFHIAAGQKINDDKWHHVVGTRDNGTMYLYLDGEEKNKKTDADFDVGVHDGHLHMMTHANRFMNAMLDEALIYKGRALSKDEINLLMKDGTESFLSVAAAGKTTTIWGRIKLIYQ